MVCTSSVWRDGSGPPSDCLGSDGDYYLDDDTGDVYTKAFGIYTIVARLGQCCEEGSGATGPTGPTGATGEGTTVERTPLSLALGQVSKQDPFTAIGIQPSALLSFADDMSVTTLTRFTQISEGTPVTPTISSNQMHLAMSGGDKNNIEKEGADIAMPQFMHTLNIASVTHSGGDTNTYENIGVGVCKDTNNFMFAVWRRKEGTFGHVAIQVKISGSSNYRGDVVLTAALTPPFDIGLSCVSNSLTFWQKPNGGAWTKLTSFDVISDFNLKTSSLTGWKPAFAVACQAAVQVTTNVTNFNAGRFGAVSFRDPVLFSNEDGSPYIPSGDVVSLTATLTDPQAAAYCGVLSLNLVTHALAQTGVIMVSRGGAIQNDNAAHVVYYSDTSSKLWITSWGSFGSGAAAIQVYYKAISAGSPDLRAVGANVISSMAQLTLPGIGLGGAYDPYAVKTGGVWYLAYTIGPVAANSFYPALASTSDLSAYTAVGSDPLNVLFEGTRIVQLRGTYYVLAASIGIVNVYDLSMNYAGNRLHPLINTSGAPAHPMLVVHGDYIYLVTFDNTLVSVASNWGQFREFRSPRYEIVL